MKKIIITTLCTLALTLMSSLGNNPRSSQEAQDINSKDSYIDIGTSTTEVEKDVNNIEEKADLNEEDSIEEEETAGEEETKEKTEAKETDWKGQKTQDKDKNNKQVTPTEKPEEVKKEVTPEETKKETSKKKTSKKEDSNKETSKKEDSKKADYNTNKNNIEDLLDFLKSNSGKTFNPVEDKQDQTDRTETKPPTTGNNGSYSNKTLEGYADEVLRLVNQERAKAGLSSLTTNPTLIAAANKRAQESRQSFSHTRPNGTSFSTALDEYGVAYRTSGENIAYGQRTPQEVVSGWMNSPGHRANILNPNFNKIGIGVYQHGGTIYWAQLFTN